LDRARSRECGVFVCARRSPRPCRLRARLNRLAPFRAATRAARRAGIGQW
jgi:hypothetical protein